MFCQKEICTYIKTDSLRVSKSYHFFLSSGSCYLYTYKNQLSNVQKTQKNVRKHEGRMLIYLLVKGSPCSDLSKTCRVVDKSNTTILNHERSQICINSCVPNAHKFVSLRAYQTLTNSYQFVYTN